MTETPLDAIEGRGRTRIGFEDIDLRYVLKMRAFIRACMQPIFGDLERHMATQALRQRGIAPIMFYLIFENSPTPLLFLGEIETRHTIRLKRSTTPDPKAPGGSTQRLLLEMDAEVWSQPGSGDPKALGTEPRDRPLQHVGRFRGLHVVTRPVAAPGERQVTEVPPEMARLKETPFTDPYPTPELISQVPAGFTAVNGGPWEQYSSVWGLPNTDVNQHVNVHEYIYGMENHFSRLLFMARLPLAQHRIAKSHLLFRKPFFPGDLYALRGKLWTQGRQTLLVGSFHQAGPEGQVDARPSVAVRMEGVIEPGGPSAH
jgi:hypothetical protein